MTLFSWSTERQDWSEQLASGVRQSLQMIESICGLDYERFTRSVLLAQGGFTAFIRAKARERSQLLEKIWSLIQLWSGLSL